MSISSDDISIDNLNVSIEKDDAVTDKVDNKNTNNTKKRKKKGNSKIEKNKVESICLNLITEIKEAIDNDNELISMNKLATNKLRISDKLMHVLTNHKVSEEFFVCGGLEYLNKLIKYDPDCLPLVNIRTKIFNILVKLNIDSDLLYNHPIKETLKKYQNSKFETVNNKAIINKILNKLYSDNHKINQNYKYLEYSEKNNKYITSKSKTSANNYFLRPNTRVEKDYCNKKSEIDRILLKIKKSKH